MSSTKDASQINGATIVIILGLALALVAGVLGGARYVFNKAAHQPVAMPEMPSPLAGSPECADFVRALPNKVLGYSRAEIAEPAPPGAAAWQRSSNERITLRCGVDMPLQYNVFAEPETVNGVSWLRVDDAIPESTMSTWFTTDRSPVLAVTADTAQFAGDSSPVTEIEASSLPQVHIDPAPAPLQSLDGGDTSACADLAAHAPKQIAEGFSLVDVPGAEPNAPTLAWSAPGREPVVLRCGVAPPPSYQAGASLLQVNNIPWFEDTEAGIGTASTWYALGRAADIAASIPVTGGNEVMTNLSNLIAGAVPAR